MLNDIHCLISGDWCPQTADGRERMCLLSPSSVYFLSHSLSLRNWPESEKKVGWPPTAFALMEADSGQSCQSHSVMKGHKESVLCALCFMCRFLS